MRKIVPVVRKACSPAAGLLLVATLGLRSGQTLDLQDVPLGQELLPHSNEAALHNLHAGAPDQLLDAKPGHDLLQQPAGIV